MSAGRDLSIAGRLAPTPLPLLMLVPHRRSLAWLLTAGLGLACLAPAGPLQAQIVIESPNGPRDVKFKFGWCRWSVEGPGRKTTSYVTAPQQLIVEDRLTDEAESRLLDGMYEEFRRYLVRTKGAARYRDPKCTRGRSISEAESDLAVHEEQAVLTVVKTGYMLSAAKKVAAEVVAARLAELKRRGDERARLAVLSAANSAEADARFKAALAELKRRQRAMAPGSASAQ